MDWENADERLNEVYSILNQVILLNNISVERSEKWRWDEPSVLVQWINVDGINRNINISLNSIDNPTILKIEINAGYDRKLTGKLVRTWKSYNFASIQLPYDQSELMEAISAAIEKCQNWKLEDLTNVSIIVDYL